MPFLMKNEFQRQQSITNFKAWLILSSLFMIFHTFLTAPIVYAGTVRVTIAHTGNLNGKLFAYKSSG
jgi:hypothetical protein